MFSDRLVKYIWALCFLILVCTQKTENKHEILTDASERDEMEEQQMREGRL